MKIYKFRPLANDTDYDRARDILETGCFWCSTFSELNDPMEGVFLTTTPSNDIPNIYGEKCKFRICSFADSTAFKKPIIWGYYANGFRGLAIQVEVRGGEVHRVQYCDQLQSMVLSGGTSSIRQILLTKLSPWKHEGEFRFLTESDGNRHRIGNITAVYFGCPYQDVENHRTIYANSPTLKGYRAFIEQLKAATHSNAGITWFPVEVDGRQVRVSPT